MAFHGAVLLDVAIAAHNVTGFRQFLTESWKLMTVSPETITVSTESWKSQESWQSVTVPPRPLFLRSRGNLESRDGQGQTPELQRPEDIACILLLEGLTKIIIIKETKRDSN